MKTLKKITHSARIYLWPIILLNSIAISLSINYNLLQGAIIGISLSFISSFGFLINDIWDRPIDRINLAVDD